MQRRVLLGAALLAAAPGPGAAVGAQVGAQEAPGAAGAFIQRLGRELPTVVAGAADDGEKRRRLEPFLARVVDVEAIARFSMGRFWRLATPAEQQAYVGLFLKVLTGEVASRIGIYGASESKVAVLPEAAEPDGVHVPTIVQTGDAPPVHVTWVVDTAASPFRILDVQAEGMSMRLYERSDFTSFLNRNGGDIEAFLAALRERAS